MRAIVQPEVGVEVTKGTMEQHLICWLGMLHVIFECLAYFWLSTHFKSSDIYERILG